MEPESGTSHANANEVWADLYRTLYPDLVRYLTAKVWDPERAQELAQEAFVRGLRQRPDDPRSWLFTVAANLARDEARTVVRRKKHLALLRRDMSEHTDGTPADALEDRERRERVREALERLTERDREALLLWDAGMNYQEIAERTGLSPSAVGTTLARARKRLVAAHRENLGRTHAAHP